MVSESEKQRQKQIKARGQARLKAKRGPPSLSLAPSPAPLPTASLPNVDPHEDLVCLGDLASDPHSRDVEIHSLSLSIQGNELVTSSELKLQYGSCYGLIGSSGCGKSTLFRALAYNKLPVPRHMEICCPTFDTEDEHMSVRQYVTFCERERAKMEDEYAILVTKDGGGGGEALECLSVRLQVFEEVSVEERALNILYSLGFDKQMQAEKAANLTNCWRMRLALAKALLLEPAILLLDEPTVILDLETCVWLANWLKNLTTRCIVVVISNDGDFLNEVCTDIIHVHNTELKQFHGSYDKYAQSNGVALSDKAPTFYFSNKHRDQLVPPVLQLDAAAYGYDLDKPVFKNLDFDVNLNSRIALIGAKESGKTTLLNLLASKLPLHEGMLRRNKELCIGHFGQHLIEELDLNLSALQHVNTVCQGNNSLKREVIELGLSRTMDSKPMRNLSYGQKVSVVFACLASKNPHIMLIDDPTTHLDIEAINSLAKALRNWTGGFVLVSNNIRLIHQVASDIYVCGSLGVMRHKGDMIDLKRQMQDHDVYMSELQDPTSIRGVYPQFAVVNKAEVAHPSLWYKEYTDVFSESFKPSCIPFADFINKRAMVATAPCTGLQEGEMDIQGEAHPYLLLSYRMITEPGKRIARSLLVAIHQSESIGECLGDFDSSNLWITPSGSVRLKGVKRKRLCKLQLRKNHMSAHKIIKEMCLEGGAVPDDVKHLLDMIEKEPEMSPLYHIHACLVHVSRSAPFFMKMYEYVFRSMTDIVLRDQILLAIPYVANGEWHTLVKTNSILWETYNYIPGRFTLPPLKPLRGQVAVTTQQLKDRLLRDSTNFLDFLRNRVSHRMDYLHKVKAYVAKGSDLAAQARFSLVNCVLQKELFKSKKMDVLNLHEYL